MFTAVGIVAHILVVLFITNTVRRRRAKKLDREIAEAKAREEQREREEKEPTPAGKRAMDNGTALNSGKAD